MSQDRIQGIRKEPLPRSRSAADVAVWVPIGSYRYLAVLSRAAYRFPGALSYLTCNVGIITPNSVTRLRIENKHRVGLAHSRC